MAKEAPITSMLLSGVTATGAGSGMQGSRGGCTFQASGTTGSGAGAATIAVQGSNDGTSWDTMGTISLTLGTTSTSDSFTADSRYALIRGNVTALSGTGAAVSLVMAC